MQPRGVEPNEFSYSAAISACEKGGQTDRALSLFEEMQHRGIKLSEVSYSATISACEKGGQWEKAVTLLQEMHQRGVEPNEISYSAAISACAKGGQWERAVALLEEMHQRGVEPNVISFNATIQACANAGQPAAALQLFGQLEAAPTLDADRVSFNAILDAVCAEPARARELWKLGCSRGVFQGFERWRAVPELDLHDLSQGAAETAVRWWLEEGVPSRVAAAPAVVPTRLELITGYGKSRAVHQESDVRARVKALLQAMGAALIPSDNPGTLLVDVTRTPTHVFRSSW